MSTQATVPDGTGLVRIGDVLVSTVPEPSSFCILVAAMSVLSLAAPSPDLLLVSKLCPINKYVPVLGLLLGDPAAM